MSHKVIAPPYFKKNQIKVILSMYGSSEALTVNSVTEKTHLNIARVNSTLNELERSGLVKVVATRPINSFRFIKGYSLTPKGERCAEYLVSIQNALNKHEDSDISIKEKPKLIDSPPIIR